MASRSATVLVIFIIAVFAFCLASVFAAMTGPITILPDDSDSSGGILDNLSAVTDDTGNSGNSYGNPDYNDYSSSDYSDDSQVETTTDSSSSDNSGVETTTDSGSSQSGASSSDANPSDSSSSDSSGVETTTE